MSEDIYIICLTSNRETYRLILDEKGKRYIEKNNLNPWIHFAGGMPYVSVRINGRDEYLHRCLLGLVGSREHVDHINGRTLDNRLCNIRAASRAQNRQNSKKYESINGRKPTSRFIGVYRTRSKASPWAAGIGKENVWHYIGCFSTERAAALAYDAKAIELYGPNAKTNFGSRAA